MILSIDPGLRGCGVALWAPDGELAAAAYVAGDKTAKDAAAWVTMAYAVHEWADHACGADLVDELVCEFPKVYTLGKSKGDPEDLLQLAAVVGCIVGKFPGTVRRVYRPSEWKGQTPKDITTARTQAALTGEERARIKLPGKSLAHNVHDAIGIGLRHLRAVRRAP